MGDFHVGIVSAGRPGSVPNMTAHMGDQPHTWYVPAGQAADYRYAGAASVSEVDGNLSDQRNAVLEAAFAEGRTAVEFNDDLVGLQWTDDGKTAAPITVAAALDALDSALETTGYRFAGTATTTNLYFYRAPLGEKHFIMAHLMMMRPCEQRFDTRMRLKEDYDYTLQHLTEYGCVARLDSLLASFAHRTNRGGAVAYRTPEAEQEAIGYLKAKWPGRIVDNPRRPNEVLMRWSADGEKKVHGE